MILMLGRERVFSLVEYPEWKTLAQASDVPHQAAGVVHLPGVPILGFLHDVFHLQTFGILDFYMAAAQYLPPHFYPYDAHGLPSPASCNSS